jgi:glucose/arabinose dehydrogenase
LEARKLLAAVPPGFVEQVWGAQINQGTAMEFAPDGRLFICTQDGTVRVISQAGVLNPTPAITLLVDSFFERGLLGIAFDPTFDANVPGDDFIYLFYTDPNGANPSFNRISRFTVTGDTINPGSETLIFSFNLLSAGNHNGGGLHFGPDGMLYAAHGENAVGGNSQVITNLLGKVIRINPNTFVPGDPESVIPGDNPSSFPGIAGTTSGINRAIWAVGLRNPFTFAFQPGTGRLHINDVGASAWEEVNLGGAGLNYGWPNTEGPFNPPSFPNFTHPLHWYANGATTAAVSGGAFYNPSTHAFPSSFTGDYFFGDLGSSGNSNFSWVRRLDAGNSYALQTTGGVGGGTDFVQGASNLVDVKVGADGYLYYLQRGTLNGLPGVRRVIPANPVVTNSNFVFSGNILPAPPHELRFTFNENVGASIGADDLLLENLTTSQTVPTGFINVSYDNGTNTAIFTFPGFTDGKAGVLPDGNYRATLPAAGIQDPKGNPLTGDHVFNFFFLNGDANRDARVNLEDFNVIAGNFGGTGVFTDGDFNYDGTINLIDFNVLAGRFGTVLSPSVAGQGAIVGKASALGTSTRIADSQQDPSDDLLT